MNVKKPSAEGAAQSRRAVREDAPGAIAGSAAGKPHEVFPLPIAIQVVAKRPITESRIAGTLLAAFDLENQRGEFPRWFERCTFTFTAKLGDYRSLAGLRG